MNNQPAQEVDDGLVGSISTGATQGHNPFGQANSFSMARDNDTHYGGQQHNLATQQRSNFEGANGAAGITRSFQGQQQPLEFRSRSADVTQWNNPSSGVNSQQSAFSNVHGNDAGGRQHQNLQIQQQGNNFEGVNGAGGMMNGSRGNQQQPFVLNNWEVVEAPRANE